jgi:pimeloyl-ACP methyl ester carboxylesterase
MATFVLIHGSGDVGWYWHLVEAELRSGGHDTVAPDLPCDDDSAGLSEYVDAVVQAIGDRIDLVVVAQSLGGFTAPIVCDRVPVKLLVLVAPMIPAPGEAPADYWVNTRYGEEVRESYDDPVATRVLLCREDRLFPPAYLRRVARERLGITPDEIDGGHTPALSRPKELAERLEAFAAEAGVISG